MKEFILTFHSRFGRPIEKIRLSQGFGFFPGLEIEHNRKTYYVTHVRYDYENEIVRIYAKLPLINIGWLKI